MRISVDATDAGFMPDANLFDIRILLDGIEVKNCLTADSDKGEILVFTGSSANGSWLTEWRKGKVEIVENGTERRL